jgi:fumarate hydratase class II
MMPVLTYDLLESIHILSTVSRTFADKCVAGIVANEERCRETLERNLAICTALAPKIGYDKAAEVAKAAHKRGTTLREEAMRLGYVTAEEFDALMRPEDMLGPK